MTLVYDFLVLHPHYLPQMPSYSVLRLWHAYPYSHRKRDSKWDSRADEKNSHILLKIFLFEVYFLKWRSLQIACVTFWLFTVYAFLFSSYVVAYVCRFPSWQWFKKESLRAGKLSYFTKKRTSEDEFSTLLVLYTYFLPQITSFSVLRSPHMLADSHPNRGSKRTRQPLKKWS